jgi:hypothetical protein
MPERQESGRRPRIVAAVRRDVLNEGRCAYCGESFFPLTVDHVIPFSRGGTDSRSNLTAACSRCNFEKLDFTPDEWKAWRLEMGHPWPPQSKSTFIAEAIRKHMPQYLAEKAAEEAALSNEQHQTGEQ